MKYTKRARALVALAVMVTCFIGGAQAHGAPDAGAQKYKYDARVVCNKPLAEDAAGHLKLVKYEWTYWGTLQLKYRCTHKGY